MDNLCAILEKQGQRGRTYDDHDMFLAQEAQRVATMFGSQAKTEQKTGELLIKPSK